MWDVAGLAGGKRAGESFRAGLLGFAGSAVALRWTVLLLATCGICLSCHYFEATCCHENCRGDTGESQVTCTDSNQWSPDVSCAGPERHLGVGLPHSFCGRPGGCWTQRAEPRALASLARTGVLEFLLLKQGQNDQSG